MNTNRLTRNTISILLTALAVIPLLISACQPVVAATNLPPTNTLPGVTPSGVLQPTATLLPTQPPAQATQTVKGASGDIALDLSAITPLQTVETVAAVPANVGGSAGAMPQYRRVTLTNYPVYGHSIQPQISIIPLADLAGTNQAAGRIAADLAALLQTRQSVDRMPFLPMDNSVQVMHVQVQYLDFKSGKGVRFLTQYNNGIVPINNTQLIYTFQGLTSDGKYYLAAVLPVTHPGLPATQQAFAQTEDELKAFPAYMAKNIAWLDQLPGNSFNPDLAKLDALVQSIVVK